MMKVLLHIKRRLLFKIADICFQVWEIISDEYDDFSNLYNTTTMEIHIENKCITIIETAVVPRFGEIFWLDNPDKEGEYIIYKVEQVGYTLVHKYLSAQVTLRKIGTGVY